MGMLTLLVFIFGLASAFGSRCTDISGTWENELGSLMRLELHEGRLTGGYCTAVESKPGASVLTSSITGVFFHRKKESLLAFSVLFDHGASLTSWVGQCLFCDGKEMLYTTYVLRTYIADPEKKWTSLVINQNTFQRTNKDYPNDCIKPDNSSSVYYPAVSDESIEERHIIGKWKSANEEIHITEKNEDVPRRESHISGKWKTNTSENVTLYGMIDTFEIDQQDLTDVEEEKEMNKIVAVALVGRINDRVRGWTGHIPLRHLGASAVLETSWLQKEFSQSCLQPRAHVSFGMGNYTKIISDNENVPEEPETLLEKIRRFFTSIF